MSKRSAYRKNRRPMELAKVQRLELYVTETLVHQGLLQRGEVLPTVQAVSDELRACAARFSAGKGMRMSGPGLQALRDLALIHTQCLRELNEGEIVKAIAETRRIIIKIQREKSAEVISL